MSTSKVTPDTRLSHMVMQWGQFLDHDLDHAMESVSRQTFDNGITCSSTCQNSPPCFPIEVPEEDDSDRPTRPRNATLGGGRCIEFTRTSGACGSGSTNHLFGKRQRLPREQLNQLSAFIDGSQIYGNQIELAISLRNLTNEHGRLREGLGHDFYGAKPFLPFNDRHEIDCRRDHTESSIGCFLAGDVRANEQVSIEINSQNYGGFIHLSLWLLRNMLVLLEKNCSRRFIMLRKGHSEVLNHSNYSSCFRLAIMFSFKQLFYF